MKDNDSKAGTKNCPYCISNINSSATKCSFCGSELLDTPSQVKRAIGNANAKVVYVIDKGLIRFAKFAAPVLAIFLVVGASLYGLKLDTAQQKASELGFKLDTALLKTSETQNNLNVAQGKLKAAQLELEDSKKTVVSLKTEVQTVLQEAKAILGEITKQRMAAIDLVVSIRELNQNQLSLLSKAKNDDPSKFRGDKSSKYWAKTLLLSVRFLDGDKDKQDQVKITIMEWFKHIGLRMEFVDTGAAEIRISFKPTEGSWSYRGTDALGVPEDQPTLNFAWLDRRTILHEFGHALGLIEEHLNPDAKIVWNKELVYRELSGPPNNWSKERINNLVFHDINKDELGQYRSFDPDSVMHMFFPSSYTGGLELGSSDSLSESDIDLISSIYPKTE